jgi:hypothetical protein
VTESLGKVRYRITVRGEDLDLRGYLEDSLPGERLLDFAAAMEPFGIVVASVAEIKERT